MKCKLKKQGNMLIVGISGELDHYSAADIRDAVDIEIKSAAVRLLIFDFSKLEFMDSSGIGIIMGRHKLLSNFGGRVCVCGASSHIEKVMLLSKLGEIVGIYKTLEECMQKEVNRS